jgi:hypothetical protein
MVGSTHVNIGIAEAGLGRLDRAAEYLSRGCKILDDALPEGHADHLRCMRSHARVLSALGRKAEAAALQQRMASSAP